LGPFQLSPVEIDTRVPLGKGVRFRDGTPVVAACSPRKVPVEDFLPLFTNLTNDVELLGVGDLVNHEFLEGSWVYRWGGLPFLRSEDCPDSLSLTPPPALHEAARRVLEELMGQQGSRESTPFLCVHWRRGDFKQYCADQGTKGRCWYGPAQAAQCAVQQATIHNLSTIFLATNAKRAEASRRAAYTSLLAGASGTTGLCFTELHVHGNIHPQ
jgi:hypothetical protein